MVKQFVLQGHLRVKVYVIFAQSLYLGHQVMSNHNKKEMRLMVPKEWIVDKLFHSYKHSYISLKSKHNLALRNPFRHNARNAVCTDQLSKTLV